MKIQFCTREYVSAYGKSPRGNGRWAFRLGTIDAEPMFVGPWMSYADAKKQIAAIARERNVAAVWVCS